MCLGRRSRGDWLLSLHQGQWSQSGPGILPDISPWFIKKSLNPKNNVFFGLNPCTVGACKVLLCHQDGLTKFGHDLGKSGAGGSDREGVIWGCAQDE